MQDTSTSVFFVAEIEGATVFSRAERNMEPCDLVCQQMVELVQRIAVGESQVKVVPREQEQPPFKLDIRQTL